jgi:hypothetical protein
MLRLTFAVSATSITSFIGACSAPKVIPEMLICPDRCSDGISQKTTISTDAGLYNGKMKGYKWPGM